MPRADAETRPGMAFTFRAANRERRPVRACLGRVPGRQMKRSESGVGACKLHTSPTSRLGTITSCERCTLATDARFLHTHEARNGVGVRTRKPLQGATTTRRGGGWPHAAGRARRTDSHPTDGSLIHAHSKQRTAPLVEARRKRRHRTHVSATGKGI